MLDDLDRVEAGASARIAASVARLSARDPDRRPGRSTRAPSSGPATGQPSPYSGRPRIVRSGGHAGVAVEVERPRQVLLAAVAPVERRRRAGLRAADQW